MDPKTQDPKDTKDRNNPKDPQERTPRTFTTTNLKTNYTDQPTRKPFYVQKRKTDSPDNKWRIEEREDGRWWTTKDAKDRDIGHCPP